MEKDKIYNASIQTLRFMTFPIWLPIAIFFGILEEIWDLCANCEVCGWGCNCPKGFGANK